MRVPGGSEQAEGRFSSFRSDDPLIEEKSTKGRDSLEKQGRSETKLSPVPSTFPTSPPPTPTSHFEALNSTSIPLLARLTRNLVHLKKGAGKERRRKERVSSSDARGKRKKATHKRGQASPFAFEIETKGDVGVEVRRRQVLRESSGRGPRVSELVD